MLLDGEPTAVTETLHGVPSGCSRPAPELGAQLWQRQATSKQTGRMVQHSPCAGVSAAGGLTAPGFSAIAAVSVRVAFSHRRTPMARKLICSAVIALAIAASISGMPSNA